MGACATKPGALKDEGEAPLPLPAEEKEPAAEEVSDDVKLEEKEDENKRTSLSHLFRESEKRREASENNEEVSVKETITTAQVETKGEEEEQTMAQVHPTHDTVIAETVEPKEISAPTHEETSVPPSILISEAPVAEVMPVEVESVKEVVSAPTHEETSVSSLIPTSEAPVAEEKPVEVESVKEVAELTKGEEEEQTKAQVHPTLDAEIAETVEPKEISAPIHEETSVPSSISISEAPVAEVKPVEVESVKKVVSAPTHGETSVSSLIPTSEAPVTEEKPVEVESIKEVVEDSITGPFEQKTTAVEEKSHAVTAVKKEDDVLPSSTTETA